MLREIGIEPLIGDDVGGAFVAPYRRLEVEDFAVTCGVAVTDVFDRANRVIWRIKRL